MIKEGYKLLNEKDFDKLSLLLNGFSKNDKLKIQWLRLEARYFLKNFGAVEGLKKLSKINKDHPNRSAILFDLVLIYLELDDIDAAKYHIQQLIEFCSNEVLIRQAKYHLAVYLDDRSSQIEQLIFLTRELPLGPIWWIHLLQCYINSSNLDEAKAIIPNIPSQSLENAHLQHVLFNFAVLSEDELLVRVACESFDSLGRKPNFFVRVIDFFHQINKIEFAIDYISIKIEQNKLPYQVFQFALTLSLEPKYILILKQWATVNISNEDIEISNVAEGILLQLFDEEELKLLKNISKGKDNIYHYLPEFHHLKREIIDDKFEEVTIAEAENSDTVVILFTGLAHRASIPLPSIDRFFAERNISSIYLRDFNRSFFNHGLKSVENGFDGAVLYLKEQIKKLNSKNVIVIGSSAGGFAAVRYGIALNATCVSTFSSVFNLTSEFLDKDPRGKLFVKRQQVFSKSVLDLRPHILKNNENICFHVLYGAQHILDKRNSEYLSGIEHINLYPVEGISEHNLIEQLIRLGYFPSVLDGLIDKPECLIKLQ